MTWKEARIIAAQHAARLQLPRDLAGARVLIADYDDEDTLRLLKAEEPGWTLRDQRLINQAFAREARKRGGRVEFVRVRVADYFAWLARLGLPNDAGNRAQFIAWLTCPGPRPTPAPSALSPNDQALPQPPDGNGEAERKA